jgi:hypothetical protein
MRIDRRALLVAGAATGLAGCAAKSPAAPATSSTSGSPSATPLTATPTLATGVGWSSLRKHLHGRLRLPTDVGYDAVRLVENPRYDGARPLAVVTVADETDVATVLSFARDHALPVAMRSGGHSYPGWSSGGAGVSGMPRALVIDCRGLASVTMTGTSVRVGAGAALAPVYAAVAASGRALAGGSCATVGISGLTLGGGVGVLTRAYGLTCDAVTGLRIVTADGVARTVDADHEPDLFWALRGGGGGHLGVVTALTFATVAAPALHTFFLSWPIGAAARVVPAWQAWAPHADARLWSTLKALGGAVHPGGPTLLLSGTWTGPGAPDLSGLLEHCPPPAVDSGRVRDYGSAMASYAGCASVPVNRCHTGPGGALDREAFGATSHVAYTTLSSAGVDTLLQHVEAAQGSGLKEAGLSMDALGGHVRDLGPGDTAFVHREALMTVQYTATFTGDQGALADRYVRGFRTAMTPSWGDHAYVNYADASLSDPAAAYFGANATRLDSVRRTYDPDGFFRQPQAP